MSVARVEGGWAGTAMRWLGRLTAPAEIGLAFIGGLLTGGVVLGFAPALRAAVAVADATLADDEDATPWRDAVAAWRGDFWASQRSLAPWGAALALVAVEASLAAVGMLPGGLAVLGPLFVVACYLLRSAVIAAILGAGSWRTALVLPAIRPGSSAVFALAGLALLIAGLAYPAPGLIFGPGLALLAATWLGRRDVAALAARQAVR